MSQNNFLYINYSPSDVLNLRNFWPSGVSPRLQVWNNFSVFLRKGHKDKRTKMAGAEKVSAVYDRTIFIQAALHQCL